MPDAPSPTVLLAFALPGAWEAAQATVTGAEPPAGPPEFAAVDVRVGAETLRLEGPGATVEVDGEPGGAGVFRVGRRVRFDCLAIEAYADIGELLVDSSMACAFLGLMRHFGWPATSGTALLRALYESEEAIPEAALAAMAAGPGAGPEEPAPEPPADDATADDHEGGREAEPAQTETPAEEPAR